MAQPYASDVVKLNAGVELRDGTVDPTTGVAAPIGSLYLRTTVPQLWQKVGAADIEWALVSGTAGANNGIFGAGLDGDVVIGAGTTVLVEDMFYNNLTISNGATLRNGGFRIFVRNTLTIAVGGVLSANGNDASGASPGAGSTDLVGTINAGSGSGGRVVVPTGQTQTQYLFGAPVNAGYGGAGGDGSGGAGAVGGDAPQVATTNGGSFTAPFLALLLRVNGPTQGLRYTSGAGGGLGGPGTGDGGAGGGGGGILMACARIIVNNGTISANGGAGSQLASANSGGGGGGGGGVAVCVTRSFTGNAPVAVGGTGGTGNGTGLNGVSGQPGMAFTLLV